MNEEQKQAVEAAKAFVASGHEYETFGVWSIEQLLSIITAQQAEIAALKAEVKRLTPHWSGNPPILVDLK